MTPIEPPRLATWILKRFGCGPNIDVILGDLAEQFQRKNSPMRYWRQAMKAIPVSLLREIRAHKPIAVRALLMGWGLWIFSLMWFFPFVSPYFFGNGLGLSMMPSHPLATAWSLMVLPIGAPIAID